MQHLLLSILVAFSRPNIPSKSMMPLNATWAAWCCVSLAMLAAKLQTVVMQLCLLRCWYRRYVLGDKNNRPSSEAACTAGLLLLASAPSQGNGSLVRRIIRRRPLFSIRMTWCFPDPHQPGCAFDVVSIRHRQQYDSPHSAFVLLVCVSHLL